MMIHVTPRTSARAHSHGAASTSAPSSVVERLLLSLGVDPDFAEGVLGDLAEEYALRAMRDGPFAARWWYAHEALRSAPHLVRSSLSRWFRLLTRRERVRLAAGETGVSAVSGVQALGLTVRSALDPCFSLVHYNLGSVVATRDGIGAGSRVFGQKVGVSSVSRTVQYWMAIRRRVDTGARETSGHYISTELITWRGEIVVVVEEDSIRVDLWLANSAGGTTAMTAIGPLAGDGSFDITGQRHRLTGYIKAGKLVADWIDSHDNSQFKGRREALRM